MCTNKPHLEFCRNSIGIYFETTDDLDIHFEVIIYDDGCEPYVIITISNGMMEELSRVAVQGGQINELLDTMSDDDATLQVDEWSFEVHGKSVNIRNNAYEYNKRVRIPNWNKWKQRVARMIENCLIQNMVKYVEYPEG